MPSAPNKILGECYQGKVNFSDKTNFFFSKKKEKKKIQLTAVEQLPEENCPLENCPHHKISPKSSCPHSSKFPRKSTTSELRRTMHELRYEYYK